MRDVMTVARKELWELQHSTKSLLWLLAGAGLLAIALAIPGTGTQSIVPLDYLYSGLPILVALGMSAQIVLDSLLSEKKTKTLEVLLSTHMPATAIVMGKVIPAVVAAYLLSQLSLLGLRALSVLDLQRVTSMAWVFFLAPLLAAYLASCVSVITTLLIPDEKFAPTVGVLILTVPLVLLARSGLVLSTTNVILIVAGVILLSTALTWLAARVLKSAFWFTRL
jgi:ABC-type Na+ efflux pump permease subunit